MNLAVTMRRVPAPKLRPDTILKVADAFLPLLWWRDLPVVRTLKRELTPMDRFLLEMALEFETLTAEDFEEIVSLPANVLAGGMTQLVAGGAVTVVDEGYRVVPEQARRATKEDFACLPRSGDLLMLATGRDGNWLRELERSGLVADCKAPVPQALWTERRGAFLARRLREGTIANLHPEVTDVQIPENDPPLLAQPRKRQARSDEGATAGVCAAYRCRAEVRSSDSGRYSVRTIVVGRSRRRGKDPDGDGRPAVEVGADLSAASGLLESWMQLGRILREPANVSLAWAQIGPAGAARSPSRAYEVSACCWEFSVSGASARAIVDEGRLLNGSVGLAVSGEEATIELSCRFAPADDEARSLFARDEAVTTLLNSATPAQDLDELRRGSAAGREASGHTLSRTSIVARIWQLRLFRLAYALREREDFIHD